jgi:pyrroline-5-carboxylate reductase
MPRKLIAKKENILFIGCGNMADALLSGRKKAAKKDVQYFFLNRSLAKAKKFAKNFKGKAFASFSALKKDPSIKIDVVFLLIKPQNFLELAGELALFLKQRPKTLVISFMAAINHQLLQDQFPVNTILRIMPHMGVANGLGSSFVFTPPNCQKRNLSFIKKWWSPLGDLYSTSNEKTLDEGVALLGSAPALVASLLISFLKTQDPLLFTESQKMKVLTECLSLLCLWHHEGRSWEDLVVKVTSSRGVTQAALEKWGQLNLDGILKQGAQRMNERALEIAKELNL